MSQFDKEVRSLKIYRRRNLGVKTAICTSWFVSACCHLFTQNHLPWPGRAASPPALDWVGFSQLSHWAHCISFKYRKRFHAARLLTLLTYAFFPINRRQNSFILTKISKQVKKLESSVHCMHEIQTFTSLKLNTWNGDRSQEILSHWTYTVILPRLRCVGLDRDFKYAYQSLWQVGTCSFCLLTVPMVLSQILVFGYFSEIMIAMAVLRDVS